MRFLSGSTSSRSRLFESTCQNRALSSWSSTSGRFTVGHHFLLGALLGLCIQRWPRDIRPLPSFVKVGKKGVGERIARGGTPFRILGEGIFQKGHLSWVETRESARLRRFRGKKWFSEGKNQDVWITENRGKTKGGSTLQTEGEDYRGVSRSSEPPL